jgi:hypothetical protein
MQTMAYPWFSTIALALVAVLAIVGMGVSVAVWRSGSLAWSYRAGLIAVIAVVALAGIGWIVFVSPVYVD